MTNIQFSQMSGRLRRTEIREILKLTRTPGTISFGGGLPDPAIFPYEAVEAASRRAIREKGRLALQYSPTEGESFLKEQASQYLKRQGEDVTPEEMLVVASSQQALDLLAKVFIDPGSPVIVERPSYAGAIQAFTAFGADFHGVDMDDQGIIPERLEKKVAELKAHGRKPRFIYLIPDFQNPSGINLTLERRKDVLRIASRYDLVIVEDSPYRELRYRGDLLPSLHSLDTEGRVIQLKTLSKVFCPGFRIGWIAAPPEILDKLVMAKQGTDLCTSAYVSIVTAYLFKDGYIERQAGLSRDLYARKAAVMLESLEKHFGGIEGASWSHPEGGMFMWLRLPDALDTVEILPEAVAAGVAYVVGSCFYTDGSGRNEMRLNFSYPTEEELGRGMRLLADVCKKQISEGITCR